jgi:tRNA pseudouridine55 synthase
MTNKPPENIILADKPKGITSFDVIRILRKKLGIRKMGHAGTLDPLASGLMIIGVNDGTKKMSEFLKLPKTYVADILLGKKSETGDMEGKIIEEKSSAHITDEIIHSAVAEFPGKHALSVPMYSAIKVGGRPLYAIARKKEAGKTLTEKETNAVPPIKAMEVLSAEILNIERTNGEIILTVKMEVTSGSYIRTLAEELGKRLSVPAMLTNLRRTEIGEYSVKDAMAL